MHTLFQYMEKSEKFSGHGSSCSWVSKSNLKDQLIHNNIHGNYGFQKAVIL